jgi:hypothetical protein
MFGKELLDGLVILQGSLKEWKSLCWFPVAKTWSSLVVVFPSEA